MTLIEEETMAKPTGPECVAIAREYGLTLVDASALQRLAETPAEARELAAEYLGEAQLNEVEQRAVTLSGIPR